MNKLIHLRYPGGFYSGTYSLWLSVIDLYAFVALHAIRSAQQNSLQRTILWHC